MYGVAIMSASAMPIDDTMRVNSSSSMTLPPVTLGSNRDRHEHDRFDRAKASDLFFDIAVYDSL
jgi:hypothetical protein